MSTSRQSAGSKNQSPKLDMSKMRSFVDKMVDYQDRISDTFKELFPLLVNHRAKDVSLETAVNTIIENVTNPATLKADLTPVDDYRYFVKKLNVGPCTRIWEFLGHDANGAALMFDDKATVTVSKADANGEMKPVTMTARERALQLLQQLKEQMLDLTEESRKANQAADQLQQQIKQLNAEDKRYLEEYNKLKTENRLGVVSATCNQVRDTGFIDSWQPWERYAEYPLSHFSTLGVPLRGKFTPYTSKVKLSSNDILSIKALEGADLCNVYSASFEGSVCVLRSSKKGEKPRQILIHPGVAKNQMDELYQQTSAPMIVQGKPCAEYKTVGDATAFYSANEAKNAVIFDSINRRSLPTFELVPEGYKIVTKSLQVGQYNDSAIVSENDTAFYSRRGFNNGRVTHSGDLRGVGGEGNGSQIVVHSLLEGTPGLLSQKTEKTHSVVCSWQTTISDPKNSCTTYLLPASEANALQASPTDEKVRALAQKEPVFSLNMEPFINSNAYAVSTVSTYTFVDKETGKYRTVLVKWGVPLQEQVEANDGHLAIYRTIAQKNFEPVFCNTNATACFENLLAREKALIKSKAKPLSRREVEELFDERQDACINLINALKNKEPADKVKPLLEKHRAVRAKLEGYLPNGPEFSNLDELNQLLCKIANVSSPFMLDYCEAISSIENVHKSAVKDIIRDVVIAPLKNLQQNQNRYAAKSEKAPSVSGVAAAFFAPSEDAAPEDANVAGDVTARSKYRRRGKKS